MDTLIEPLTYITNLSLIQGIFPDELKKAKIIPLYKSNDPMLFNNYRPISLLPLFSKVLERIMYNRIIKFINKHKILYKYQFGFRKDHSTYMALIILIDKITSALDNGNFTIAVLIDFRKAFDTVDHEILLHKLHHYGIRGIAHDWLKSYLCDRQQQVTYNGASSSYKNINCGVPQGSILGPLLFIIYINDLSTVSNILTSVLFADDTTLIDSDKNLSTLVERFNKELENVVNWLNANRLSLNIDKTNFMIFRPKNRNDESPYITINGSQIYQATTNLDKIHKLQKKIVRIINGVPPMTHTQPLFEKLKVMTVYQLYRYYVGVFMFKLYHNQLPPLFNMFDRTSNIHSYSTRQSDCFYINYVPTLRSQRTIRITGPKLWNVLITNINIHCKISSYKMNLKKTIFSIYDLP